jgi:hypothetical protein
MLILKKKNLHFYDAESKKETKTGQIPKNVLSKLMTWQDSIGLVTK